ncbi:MAG TPA: hypothetical protein VK900_14945 [Anaerolineales bacterium]|nr:hypothetical protein [Anaerolineales bacterium]
MSELSQNVIMDLMPLYLAGEASDDTTALVKQYIDSNPEIAEIVDQMRKAEAMNEAPIPFSKEVAIKTFQEAKKWMVIRTLGLAFIIGFFSVTALIMTYAFFYFMRYGSPPI